MNEIHLWSSTLKSFFELGKYWSSQRKDNNSKQRGQFTELNHGHYKKCLPEMLEEVKMMAEDTCDAVYYHTLCVYHNHGIIWQCKLNWWFILALVTGTLLIIGLLIICLVMGSCSR